jgi:predicted ArsR family transcriptional regulator
LRYLEESEGPVRVAAIAAHLDLNHTGIRRHLAALRDAGLVVEERASSGAPGRPPLQYRPARAGTARPAGAGMYEELTVVLLDLRTEGRSPRAAGADAGRRVVVSEGPTTDSLDRLEAEMARRGFEPELRRTGSVVELVTRRCAVEAAAAADPDVVCEIHLGLIEGILEGTGGDLELRAATRRDPSRGGCRFDVAPVEP